MAWRGMQKSCWTHTQTSYKVPTCSNSAWGSTNPLIEKPSTERQKNPLAIQVVCECHLISRSPGHPSGSIVVGEGNVYLQPERLPSWPMLTYPRVQNLSDRRSGWNFRAGPLLQELENMHEGFHLSCVPFGYIFHVAGHNWKISTLSGKIIIG